MKQTFFVLILLSIFLGSCSSLSNAKKIETFEKNLGVDNSTELSNYVLAFENQVLKANYPELSTDKAYLELLSTDPREIVKRKLYDSFTDYNLEQYYNSQLWHEIYAPVDSVWIKNHHLNARYVYLSEDGEKKVGQVGGMVVNEITRDSLIQQELSICHFNNIGKYWLAIESIKDDVPFLEEFYSAKTRWSHIGIGHFSALVHQNKLDLNDYLVKRIVAVELGKFLNDAREPKKIHLLTKPKRNAD